MKLLFEQRALDLYSAGFTMTGDPCACGSASMTGSMKSMEAVWNGQCGGRSFQLSPVSGRIVQNGAHFRPYNFSWNDGSGGTVYQTERKDGFFSTAAYHELVLNGQTFQLYPVDLGKEGTKFPLYCGDRQLALIEKDGVIVNGLHSYRIHSAVPQALPLCVLLCCYMYTLGCYRPGQKPIRSTQRVYNKTRSKFLLSKYDPAFLSTLPE